jgi:hypothetical protein
MQATSRWRPGVHKAAMLSTGAIAEQALSSAPKIALHATELEGCPFFFESECSECVSGILVTHTTILRSGPRQGSIQPVLEQSDGAGPSERPIAGIQAIRPCGDNDLRNRTGREDQEGAIQNGQTRRVQGDDDGTVECGTRSLNPICNHSTTRSLTDLTVSLSLHQSLQTKASVVLRSAAARPHARERGGDYAAFVIGSTTARAVDTYVIDKGKPGTFPLREGPLWWRHTR